MFSVHSQTASLSSRGVELILSVLNDESFAPIFGYKTDSEIAAERANTVVKEFQQINTSDHRDNDEHERFRSLLQEIDQEQNRIPGRREQPLPWQQLQQNTERPKAQQHDNEHRPTTGMFRGLWEMMLGTTNKEKPEDAQPVMLQPTIQTGTQDQNRELRQGNEPVLAAQPQRNLQTRLLPQNPGLQPRFGNDPLVVLGDYFLGDDIGQLIFDDVDAAHTDNANGLANDANNVIHNGRQHFLNNRPDRRRVYPFNTNLHKEPSDGKTWWEFYPKGNTPLFC